VDPKTSAKDVHTTNNLAGWTEAPSVRPRCKWAFAMPVFDTTKPSVDS
jgi:hypothetical protein